MNQNNVSLKRAVVFASWRKTSSVKIMRSKKDTYSTYRPYGTRKYNKQPHLGKQKRKESPWVELVFCWVNEVENAAK